MMKSVATIPLFLFIISCELVTEVNVPEVPPTLVVNGVYIPDSTWFIKVSQMNYILTDHNYQPPNVGNVSVTISGSDGQTATLWEAFAGPGVIFFASDQRPRSGQTYTINVSAPGYESATASSVAPTPVELIDVHLDSANLIPRSQSTEGSIPIEFTFQDTPGEKDYYYPKFQVVLERMVRQPDGALVKREIWIEHDLTETVVNESISDLQSSLTEFDDKRFDGKRHTMRLHVNIRRLPLPDPSNPTPKQIGWRFYLTRGGEDYYKYFRSVRLQQQNDGNPFAQPVQIYTNVQGGLGIFAGAVTSEWRSPK